MEENGEETHSVQASKNMDELNDSGPAEEEDLEPQTTPTMVNISKSSGENSRKRRKPESNEVVTPLLDRPSRERKLVERFIDSVEMEKEKPKEKKIEQGSGTCLRDIPNVVFKFSKRKSSDETLQFLHKLLYNRRAKPQQVKTNILQFSGWVWGANEEKEKSKLKEKLEKCFKESLWQVSDVFDLNLPKTTKKEDMVLKVLEFLVCPYKTTEKLLEEQEQKAKGKKWQERAGTSTVKAKNKKLQKTSGTGKKRKSSGQTPSKKQRREGKSSNGSVEEQEEEEHDDDEQDPEAECDEEPEEVVEGEEEPEEVQPKKMSYSKPKKPSSARKGGGRSAKKSSDSEDAEAAVEEIAEEEEEAAEEPEEVENDPEEKEEEELKQKQSNKKTTDNALNSVSPKTISRKRSIRKPVNEPPAAEEEGDDNEFKPQSKVSKLEPSKEVKAPQGKKKADTGSSKVGVRQRKQEKGVDTPLGAQRKVRGKSQLESKESKPIPSDDDLSTAICELLQDADFSKVTFTDVVKQLEAKFDVDLSQRKAHVRVLTQEEITKLVEEDDGEAEGNDEDAGVDKADKMEPEPTGTAAAKE